MTSTLAAVNRPGKFTPLQQRFSSIDIIRGAVMILMAIDHVRVYSGIPAGGPDPGVFFTRWVTHFCAPAFAFFAGTGAFLFGARVNSKSALAKFLLVRGFLLVVLELTLIRLSWSFNFNFSDFILFGVIWMLGWCMILLAAFIWWPTVVIGVLGLIIIAAQQVFEKFPVLFPSSSRDAVSRIWNFIYPTNVESWQGTFILYVLVPWIGVMMAGYAFGAILRMDAVKRRRLCLWIGLTAIGVFLIAGCIIVLNKPSDPSSPPFIMQLLNQRKYPASPLFLLMTLGPVIALIPFAEKAKGWLANILATVGKVPMFYYLVHIPLIHLTAVLVQTIKGASGFSSWYASAPYVNVPPEYKWNLGLLYLVFIIDVIILYFLCRWYVQYKFSHPKQKWLKYI